MSLLFPLGLLGLLSIPVLLWLWRLSATRRQTTVASLIPFEHLLVKPPRKRSRLIVNLLFWLQLAACAAVALALARPVFRNSAVSTCLVIVDTSASLQAKDGLSPVFEQGLRRLRERMDARGSLTQWFVMASAPVAAITPRPVGSAAEAERAIRAFGTRDMSGNLAAAAQIGQALLGRAPDGTLVMTDEAQPADATDPGLEWISIGGSLPNVALVGVDAEPPLCGQTVARLVASVENLSGVSQAATLTVTQEGRRIAERVIALEAHARFSAPLEVPEGAEGWVWVAIAAPKDALELDNRAAVLLRRSVAVPVAIVSEDSAFRTAVAGWLNACEGLVWSVGIPQEPGKAHILVTDQEDVTDGAAIGAVYFSRQADAEGVRPAYWMVEPDHAVGRYLSGVEPAGLRPSEAVTASAGETVVWALVRGGRVPVVSTREQGGRRSVHFALAAAQARESSQVVVSFLNSLRWLIGGAQSARTGEPMAVAGLRAGPVTVAKPGGDAEPVAHGGGLFVFDDTSRSGIYRVAQGDETRSIAVNFLNPLESNLEQRLSTWRFGVVAAPAEKESRAAQAPLSPAFLWIAAALLLLEWLRYGLKGRRKRLPMSAQPEGRGASATAAEAAAAARRAGGGT